MYKNKFNKLLIENYKKHLKYLLKEDEDEGVPLVPGGGGPEGGEGVPQNLPPDIPPVWRLHLLYGTNPNIQKIDQMLRRYGLSYEQIDERTQAILLQLVGNPNASPLEVRQLLYQLYPNSSINDIFYFEYGVLIFELELMLMEWGGIAAVLGIPVIGELIAALIGIYAAGYAALGIANFLVNFFNDNIQVLFDAILNWSGDQEGKRVLLDWLLNLFNTLNGVFLTPEDIENFNANDIPKWIKHFADGGSLYVLGQDGRMYVYHRDNGQWVLQYSSGNSNYIRDILGRYPVSRGLRNWHPGQVFWNDSIRWDDSVRFNKPQYYDPNGPIPNDVQPDTNDQITIPIDYTKGHDLDSSNPGYNVYM